MTFDIETCLHTIAEALLRDVDQAVSNAAQNMEQGKFELAQMDLHTATMLKAIGHAIALGVQQGRTAHEKTETIRASITVPDRNGDSGAGTESPPGNA
jgi:hypothetical protein